MLNEQQLAENLINIWQEGESVKHLPSEGKSMYPLIQQGDKIKIKFTKPENIKIGDIAAFRKNHTIIVHRLIKKINSAHAGVMFTQPLHAEAGFIEKGDFHTRGSFISSNDIIGKIEIQPEILNYILAFFGIIIYKLGKISKPLLVIPFIINAGTRTYIKLRKN